MKNFTTVILACIAITSGCAQQQIKPHPNWHLAYHHDANGIPISGSKKQLVEAINQGRPIRIVWPINDNFTHVADSGFLTVMKGEVFAQFDGIIRQMPDFENMSIALDAENQSHWHAIVSTTGQLQSFQSSESQLGGRQFAFKWYFYGTQ